MGIMLFMACSKSDDNGGGGNHNCDFSVPAINAPADGTVKYEANLTGTGTITSLVIKNSSGADSTITSPTLPFQTTLNIASGTAIAISAKGSTTGGQIEIKYTFNGGGSLQEDKEECGN